MNWKTEWKFTTFQQMPEDSAESLSNTMNKEVGGYHCDTRWQKTYNVRMTTSK